MPSGVMTGALPKEAAREGLSPAYLMLFGLAIALQLTPCLTRMYSITLHHHRKL